MICYRLLQLIYSQVMYAVTRVNTNRWPPVRRAVFRSSDFMIKPLEPRCAEDSGRQNANQSNSTPAVYRVSWHAWVSSLYSSSPPDYLQLPTCVSVNTQTLGCVTAAGIDLPSPHFLFNWAINFQINFNWQPRRIWSYYYSYLTKYLRTQIVTYGLQCCAGIWQVWAQHL